MTRSPGRQKGLAVALSVAVIRLMPATQSFAQSGGCAGGTNAASLPAWRFADPRKVASSDQHPPLTVLASYHWGVGARCRGTRTPVGQHPGKNIRQRPMSFIFDRAPVF